MRNFICLLVLLSIVSCRKNEDDQPTPTDTMYFPSNTSTVWDTSSISSLGWNESAVQPLNDFLIQKNTKAFIILVNGRIVIEEYFDGHSVSNPWEWNSAGKTLVSTTTGIAQQEGLLNINNKASDYLGIEWANMPLPKENLITVRHLLSMTTGNDDTKQLVIKSNLTYVADAGTRWAYSNIFQKLTDVVANSSNSLLKAISMKNSKVKLAWTGIGILEPFTPFSIALQEAWQGLDSWL
jgi:hypothetical protein